MTTPDPTLEARAREIALRLAEFVDDRADAAMVRSNAESEITAALKAARLEGMEAAAKIIDGNQQTTSNTADGSSHHLTPRKPGNSDGLAYAAAIRQAKEG